jgi:hypothetical protein
MVGLKKAEFRNLIAFLFKLTIQLLFGCNAVFTHSFFAVHNPGDVCTPSNTVFSYNYLAGSEGCTSACITECTIE